MSRKHVTRMTVLITVLAAFMAAAGAQQNQNQNANQPQNQQGQQSQPVQPSQKKSFWQKVKDVSQAGQNAAQQGSNTVQQGRGTIQQTGQQVQGTIQQIPNQGSVQQGPDASQGAANGFQANGGGAGTCGPSCFDAGPFQANVSQMTTSQEGAWHVIRMNIQLHNSTNQPLVIAYHDGSMVMVDNNGNTYIPAGGNPGQLQGMGVDRGNQTDSQFQLAPGQTGYALFSVARGRAANSPIGTSYSYNLTIDELQLQNGALAIPVRTYNLNFPSLAPGTSNASFGSVSSPATGLAANGNRSNSVGSAVPQANVQNVPGQRQAGIGVGTGIGAATPQQRIVNGKPATTAPLQSTAVNNAAMRTAMPATTKAAVSTPARAQAAPVVASKPNPATPAVKPAPAPPQKKVPSTAATTNK